MHIFSEAGGTDTRRPADRVGENFSLVGASDSHHPIEDLQLLTDEMLASIGTGEEKPAEVTASGADDFEGVVNDALKTVGGELLFQIRHQNDEECRHVAAVALGRAEERRLVLVILNADGNMRLEPTETSDNPIAHLARSYLWLAEAYRSAA